MSVDVKYKGTTITTVEAQETKTLTTAGKYCEGDIVLTDDRIIPPAPVDAGVNFIDFEGTLLYTWPTEDVAGKTELPTIPQNRLNDTFDGLPAGLRALEWNWDLSHIKDFMADNPLFTLVVGLCYEPVDQKNHFYLEVDDNTSFYLGVGVNGSVTVDWGDGSPLETVSGTSYSTNVYTPHTYESGGAYCITIDGIVEIRGSASHHSYLFAKSNGDPISGNLTSYIRYALKCAQCFNLRFAGGAFHGCNGLQKISISPTCESTNAPLIFRQSGYLPCSIVIPIGFKLNNQWNEYAYFIGFLSTPQDINQPWRGFEGNNYLRAIPHNVKQAFNNASMVKRIISQKDWDTFYRRSGNLAATFAYVAENITSIVAYALYSCYGLKEVQFAPLAPPAVANVNAWTDIPTDCIMTVPFPSLAAYLTATNYPAPATYAYVGFATYEDGETLPTQDSTEAYNVVWYASKADAVNEQNPITVGNGKEIYCRYTEVSE